MVWFFSLHSNSPQGLCRAECEPYINSWTNV